MNRIIELPKEYFLEFERYKNNTSPVSVRLRIKYLSDIKYQIERNIIVIKQDTTSTDSLLDLKNILLRFHKVARQLRNRYNKRTTIEINDEYDVQNLLHALLHIYFSDIRAEEWTPSYAGSSVRQDFLLKNEKVVIEVKKTRK